MLHAGWESIGHMDLNRLYLNRSATFQSHFHGESVPASTPVVFVADEDLAVHHMLQPLVTGAGWQAQTFEWTDDFPAQAPAFAPSCLILDLGVADVHGVEVQRSLAERPELPIIFLSDARDVRTAVQAMKAGAHEFLTKPVSGEVLLSAIRDAMERSRAALARRAALDLLRERYATLSPREREVMDLVVRGRLNKQIAGELGISEITVKAHRGKMMRKMAVRTVPDLVKAAAKLFPAD